MKMWMNLQPCSAVLSAVLVAIPESSSVIEEDPDAPIRADLQLRHRRPSRWSREKSVSGREGCLEIVADCFELAE